jgi:dipeptidyl-peptidase-4
MMGRRDASAQEVLMRRLLSFLVMVSAPLVAGQQPLTLDRIFSDPPLEGTLPREVRWLPGGGSFSFLEKAGNGREAPTTLWVEDTATGGREAVVNDTNLATFGEGEGKIRPRLEGYQWSPKGDALLLSGGGELFILERGSRRTRRLTSTPAEEELARFSPDGRRIAFVRDNDLYVLELTSDRETRITTDGSPDRFNGKLDWVYAEEISERSALGYAWSPDSRAIAYITLDESKVRHFPQVDLLLLQPTVEEQRYPRPGDPNPVATLTVANVADSSGLVNRQTLSWTTPNAEYLPRFGWLRERQGVWFELLNRAQTRLELVRLDTATGTAATLLVEEDPAWVNLHDDLRFFKDGSFLWSSERSGYRHLYLYSSGGQSLRQLTFGDWEVTGVEEVDEEGGWVYYTSTQAGLLGRNLYRVRVNGKGASERITQGPGTHRANVAPGGRYVVDSHSGLMRPTAMTLLDFQGRPVRVLAANDHPALESYRTRKPEIVEVAGPDGQKLYGSLLKPIEFDPAKRYPVIVYVYGGPGLQMVQDAWGARSALIAQVLAGKGFVVFSLDGRGTPARGRDFERTLLRRLGRIELEDQLAGVEWLKRQPWVDGQRIGIWGGSYGGFMTCYAMTNAPDVFRAGVAIASLTDWHLYDSVYTERYLKIPAENPEGYRDSSPVNQADKLKGALLLMHGTADDNVHWHNTLIFADRLVKAGIHYELQLYTGATHRFYRRDQRLDEYARLLEFFERHLRP